MIASPPDSRRTRDDRIDFLRGLALLIICIDHIHGNPIARLMPASFGLSDMSEVFLFLSGIVSGWSFQRTQERSGTWSAARRCWFRALNLYAIYVVAGTLLVLLMRQTSTVFLLNTHREAALFSSPGELLLRIATVQQHVGHLCILPLYVICLSVLPVAAAMYSHRGARVLLGLLMLGSYLSAQWPATRFPLPPDLHLTLYYQPLAWVPLFLLGSLCGQSPSALRPPTWLWVTAILTITGLAVSQSVGLEVPTNWRLKPTLGPLRLLHFLSLALLVANILPRSSTCYLAVVRHCGQNSLATYVAGAFASVLLSTAWASSRWDLPTILVANGLAVGVCLLAAKLNRLVSRWLRRSFSPKPSTEQPATTPPKGPSSSVEHQ